MAAKKAAKKPAAKKAAPAKKLTAIKEKYTKSSILAEIADNTELSKKQVSNVIDELSDLIQRHVKKGGTLPGLLKIKTVKKPARKARKGVPNPFRPGEVMDIAAKPASTKIKVLPLKGLKEFV
jgi:nucleoid DNA-binding protein